MWGLNILSLLFDLYTWPRVWSHKRCDQRVSLYILGRLAGTKAGLGWASFALHSEMLKFFHPSHLCLLDPKGCQSHPVPFKEAGTSWYPCNAHSHPSDYHHAKKQHLETHHKPSAVQVLWLVLETLAPASGIHPAKLCPFPP